MRHVGALLDAGVAHGARRAGDHLFALAHSNRLPVRRVAEVLEETGLSAVAGKRVRTFSLGMRQRLGIAAALLGDPAVLMLDEPANGLDPEGIIWIRTLLKRLAADGRTVLVSSRLMTETALTADHLIVLGREDPGGLTSCTSPPCSAPSGRRSARCVPCRTASPPPGGDRRDRLLRLRRPRRTGGTLRPGLPRLLRAQHRPVRGDRLRRPRGRGGVAQRLHPGLCRTGRDSRFCTLRPRGRSGRGAGIAVMAGWAAPAAAAGLWSLLRRDV